MPNTSRSYARYVLGLLCAINFFNYVDRLVIVTMYDDLRAHFHFNDAQLGALWFAFFAVHALATIPLGWLADRFDRRQVMGFGVIIWSLATLGSGYARGFGSMLVLRGMIGIGEAAYGPASNALLCELFPDTKARAVGIFNGGMFAGAVAGLAAGNFLGFPRAFQVVALPGLILGVLALRLDVSPRRVITPGEPTRMGEIWRKGIAALRPPSLRWMLASGILISFAAGGYITWIVDFTENVKHLDKNTATIIYAAITLTAGIAGVLCGGWVADRLIRRNEGGRPLTIGIGFLGAFPFSILILVFPTGVPYFVVSWLLMFFIPWYNGPIAAVIDDVVDDADASTAQATFVFFLHTVGTGPSAFVLGMLARESRFLIPSAAVLLAAVFALMSSRRIGADMRARKGRATAAARVAAKASVS